jgi:hypothetical protein
MQIKPTISLALVLCVSGCASMTTSSFHCTSLSHDEQELICSDLNHFFVSNGFTAGNPSETPWAMGCWDNWSFSPLWKGRADFSVAASTNSDGMDIDILYYEGQISANKVLVEAIAGCVHSNAPNAVVSFKVKTEHDLALFKE